MSALVGSCNASSQSLVFATMVAPQKLLDALPEVATAAVGGALDSSKSGSGITLERFTVTVGSTKGGAALPKWDTASPACAKATLGHTNACETTCVDDCTALRDDDKDTFPGVTIAVCGRTASDQQSGVPCHIDHPDDPGATLQEQGLPRHRGRPAVLGHREELVRAHRLRRRLHPDSLPDRRHRHLARGRVLGVDQTIGSLPSFQVDPAASKFRMVRVDGKYGAPDWKIDPL